MSDRVIVSGILVFFASIMSSTPPLLISLSAIPCRFSAKHTSTTRDLQWWKSIVIRIVIQDKMTDEAENKKKTENIPRCIGR